MLTVDSLNPASLKVQYAVRGELAIRAEEYRVQLKTGNNHNLPFNKVISSNIGNPQQLGLDQPPITFLRQVGCLSLTLDALALINVWHR
jgi:alanine transaminase